ncbi:response regulator [Olivibacter sp. LS-1]|uniref:Response regulator receiver protein n=3 Tax=Sphingobacteriaceae TaxID=84566 RepID=F4CCC9_SPHS2|nr:response regulator [Olivibacter sp. LS-1]
MFLLLSNLMNKSQPVLRMKSKDTNQFTYMKQIIVVEDDKDIRELVEYLLVNEQFDVKSCANVKEFRQRIQGNKPNLILLDIMLPDGNGVDLCRELYRDEKTKDIPVVLMSAHGRRNLVETEHCVRDFIEKPFDIDHFINTINHYSV